MSGRISRQKLAAQTADGIVSGDADATRRLAAYLLDTRRTDEAELIARDIEHALVGRGIVLADVTSARQLSAESRQAIKEFIGSDTKAKQITLREKVDPSVIGGVRVKYGGRLLDATVATKLERLA